MTKIKILLKNFSFKKIRLKKSSPKASKNTRGGQGVFGKNPKRNWFSSPTMHSRLVYKDPKTQNNFKTQKIIESAKQQKLLEVGQY